MAHVDAGLLVLRVIFGLFLAYHGYNKFFGKGGLAGTAKWFGGIGMKWPIWQARMAATTEVGAGVLFASGLLTPLAAAGIIGVMTVAIYTSHLKVGFFVFLPNQGWEYCASIVAAALGVALIGPGRASLDHVIGWNWTAASGWIGVIIAAAAGFGGGALQLATCYRPPRPAASTPATSTPATGS